MESNELHKLGIKISVAFSELSGVQEIASHAIEKKMISEEQRFRLWAHSLGLHYQGHSSLDYRVRDAVAVKSRLADILAELKEHLDNLVSIHRGERPPFEIAAASAADTDDGISDHDGDAKSTATALASPSLSSSEMSFHEVKFHKESVAETLDALYSLATKIKNPRNRPHRAVDELRKHISAHLRKEVIQECEEAAIAIVCYVYRQQLLEGLQHGELNAAGLSRDEIMEQYASPSSWLIRRSGIANARRKQQFMYWKEHAERISKGPTGNTPPPRADERQDDHQQPFQTQAEHELDVPFRPLGATLSGSLATVRDEIG